MTPDQFREKMKKTRAAWDRLIDPLPPHRLEQLQLPNGWSLKTLIYHISWYEAEMVNLLQTKTLAGSPLWELSPAERNQAVARAAQELDAAALLIRSRDVYAQLSRLAAALTEKELLDPAQYQGMPEDWVPWQLIADNSFAHYDEHLPELQALLE